MGRLPPPTVLGAFGGLVVLIGLNLVAVRMSNIDLAPTWGAALRFGLAAALMSILVAARGYPLPRGRALVGAALFGALTFGVFFGFMYWGLVEVRAATGSVFLSTVPLLTFLTAVTVRVERFRWRALAGALIVIFGIWVLTGGRGAEASYARLGAVLVACVASALGNVVVKGFPASHPLSMNVVGMTVAFVLLLVVSALRGDAWVLPEGRTSVVGVWFLVLSSLVLFPLLVWVIQQWTASAGAYGMVLSPLVATPVAVLVLGETVGARFALAAAIIVAGVYIGALARVHKDPDADGESA